MWKALGGAAKWLGRSSKSGFLKATDLAKSGYSTFAKSQFGQATGEILKQTAQNTANLGSQMAMMRLADMIGGNEQRLGDLGTSGQIQYLITAARQDLANQIYGRLSQQQGQEEYPLYQTIQQFQNPRRNIDFQNSRNVLQNQPQFFLPTRNEQIQSRKQSSAFQAVLQQRKPDLFEQFGIKRQSPLDIGNFFTTESGGERNQILQTKKPKLSSYNFQPRIPAITNEDMYESKIPSFQQTFQKKQLPALEYMPGYQKKVEYPQQMQQEEQYEGDYYGLD